MDNGEDRDHVVVAESQQTMYCSNCSAPCSYYGNDHGYIVQLCRQCITMCACRQCKRHLLDDDDIVDAVCQCRESTLLLNRQNLRIVGYSYLDVSAVNDSSEDVFSQTDDEYFISRTLAN